jgi:light-regulated signal transduction histidine kinase (bacteriophytochrome)
MIEFINLVSRGTTVYSTLPESFPINRLVCNKFKTGTCPLTKKDIRYGYFEFENFEIFLVSYDKNATNKILLRYADALKLVLPIITNSHDSLEKSLNKNFRRLKHNIVTHTTNIHQELEKSFPTSPYSKGGQDQLNDIKSTLQTDTHQCAKAILKLIKSSNLLRFEFDIYDLLSSPNPYLEFDEHEIHKIILFNLNPYWFDLVQKGITINIQNCYEKVRIDPKSISVVLSLMFENATKYIANNTEFLIKFQKDEIFLSVILEMTSLKIMPENINKIMHEGISGELAKKLGLAGDGLGLSISNRLIKMNQGELIIKSNVSDQKKMEQMAIPYEQNQFIIKLKNVHTNAYKPWRVNR